MGFETSFDLDGDLIIVDAVVLGPRLYDHGLVSFVPAPGRPQPPELPPLARAFLATLVPTFRPR